MAEVKWIKMSTDIFDNRKIRQIRKMPEGDSILGIWLQILCVAGKVNDCGAVYFTPDIPYTDTMLSTEFDRPIQIIRLAFDTFVKFEMIEIVNNILYVSNWEKYQNVNGLEKVREQTKKRVTAYRTRIKSIQEQCNVTVTLPVTQCNATDKDIDKDIDIKEIYKEKKSKIFRPPSLLEVKEYCKERNNDVDSERFLDFYASKGWYIGKNKMKDWKAAVRTWESKDKPNKKDYNESWD